MARPPRFGFYESESTGDVLQDFQARIMAEPMSGCWLWIGDCTVRGYGRLKLGNGPQQLAHRLSYELFVGRIPEGMVIDHKCKTLCCVNPDHLEAVTQKENVRRGNAAKIRKETCDYGHPLIAIRAGTQRICKTCQNARRRASRARKHGRV